MKKALARALALLLCAMCFVPAASAEAQSVPGQPFPDFTMTDAEGSSRAPDATTAFPVAASRGVYVDNDGARQVFFTSDAPPRRLAACIVGDSVAHVRVTIAPDDDPYDMVCYSLDGSLNRELPTLLSDDRSAFVLDVPMPQGGGDFPFAGVFLKERADADAAEAVEVYLIPDEGALDALREYLGRDGWVLDETGGASPAAPEAPKAYKLYVVDQYGDPVPNMYVNFCTDRVCSLGQGDENGVITFEGAPDRYHVQLLKAPEGYSFDPSFELYTETAYGAWQLRIRKDAAE